MAQTMGAEIAPILDRIEVSRMQTAKRLIEATQRIKQGLFREATGAMEIKEEILITIGRITNSMEMIFVVLHVVELITLQEIAH